MMRLMMVGVAAVVLGACASVRGVRSEPATAGEEQMFRASVGEAALAVRNALLATHLRIREAREVDPERWYLIAQEDSEEVVRVWCERAGEGVTAVRVLVKRDILARLGGGPDWAETLFAQIALELERAGA